LVEFGRVVFELQGMIFIFSLAHHIFIIHSFDVSTTQTGIHGEEVSLLLLGVQGHKDAHAAYQSVAWHGGHGAIQRRWTHMAAV
jgi:hypothetical protein